MSVFAVIATHRLKPDCRPEWASLAMENARASRHEPGCLQFDVVLARDDQNLAYLIERYVDEASFREHFGSSYAQKFMASIEGMLVKRVRTLGDIAE